MQQLIGLDTVSALCGLCAVSDPECRSALLEEMHCINRFMEERICNGE